MQRYTPGALPGGGAIRSAAPAVEDNPLRGAEQVCALVRAEHGRAGVGRFLAAAAPFLPGDFIRQLAQRVGVDAPHAETPAHEKPPAPQMKPEQLMKLMNLANGGGSGDAASLLKLFSEMGRQT